MSPIKIAPSILSADFAQLKDQIALAEEGGADWIHLDVMDGHFVPNMTFGPPIVRNIRRVTSLPLDTHLMMDNADRYIEAFHAAGSDLITVHFEASPHLHRTIQRIKDLGARAGVAINPATPVSSLSQIAEDLDLVLIMSVNPGFGGQSFIPFSCEKIRQAAELLGNRNSRALIEVDGGIDTDTAAAVVDAGATVLVSGSFIFGSPDVPGAVRKLRSSVNHS